MPPPDFQHESTKQRALRIPLSYVQGGDNIQRWKLGLTVVAALATAAYAGWAMWGRTGPVAFSHGPVANVHAAWDHNCSACHFDFSALRDDGFDPLVKAGLVSPPRNTPTDLPLHHRANQKCQTCHAGPQHHDNEIASDVGTCASCHQDHRGRSADLARPPDAACTRCHANIAEHRRSGAVSKFSPPTENVVQFHSWSAATEQAAKKPHPEFRSLADDPGNVKFTHHQHLKLGIPVADPRGEGRKLMTLADLPEQDVERYRRPDQPRGAKRDDEYYVQLDCASCHRADSTDDRSAAPGRSTPPASGAYMLPVRFDDHCAACHHLNYEPARGKEVKHGLPPVELRQYLLGRFASESESVAPADEERPFVPRRKIPGRSPSDVSPIVVNQEIIAKADAALASLQQNKTCEKCHLLKRSEQPDEKLAFANVEPANIPQIWLQHARFDHAAHRAVRCAECHVAAFPPSSGQVTTAPRDEDVVMIAGRDVCLKCHAPSGASGAAGATSGAVAGGARFDCAECHRYHAADAPGHGIGAKSRGVPMNNRRSIEAFLQGAASPPAPAPQPATEKQD